MDSLIRYSKDNLLNKNYRDIKYKGINYTSLEAIYLMLIYNYSLTLLYSYSFILWTRGAKC